MKERGFTLAEIAIVLVIIGIMLAGGLGAFKAQTDSQRMRDGRAQMAEIKESLLGFAVQHGYLPCPADPALATFTEDRAANGTCNRAQGSIPGATLGLPRSTDPFNKPFTYRLTLGFADNGPASLPPVVTDSNQTLGVAGSCPLGSVAPAGMSFMLCSSGDILIYPTSGAAAPLASNVIAVVVMHYRHGPPNGVAGSADEQENTNNDVNFVSKLRAEDDPATPADEEYDDFTDWISPSILAARMLAAGKLP
ncbi:type II secretion system protein [Iodobacter sp. HSC-16F04]|uniref:Type II secretion system protein n=1 Tax=Iodobacter violaceini TaxID=3044271 RepID=A0ABX0L1W6_9NEIS|nr:type II secretion system protein [Iodobacter violacea]NHQ87406.1 type II secretion system protein [Iodobacter violacea]